MSSFTDLWREISDIGGSPSEGYVRFAWTAVEWELRTWFRAQAKARDLEFEVDGNTTMWATWNPGGVPGPAVVTGSHLDSVPHGGGYDGPLGVVSAFLAVDELRRRGVVPARPIRIAAFAEEEGSRFGVACLGSRLMTGAFDPERARTLTDSDGVTLAEALAGYDFDPARLGPAPLSDVAAFVELHVEQGRALTVPVGIGSSIWPHGRWRMDFTGEGNHAGTTLMGDRHDPMLTYAFAVLAANKEARTHGAHATVGRVAVHPNATNAIPSRVTGWLDARAASASTLDDLLSGLSAKIATRAGKDGTTVTITAESTTGEIGFSDALIERCLTTLGEKTPVLPTGAGHDAGVLSAFVPTVMLFVRNPAGVSHAPAERADDEDCEAGVEALADVLAELACR
ncbi:N-carbamoyl-L-amino-acid hydrolase [Catenuloplanes nepalensis]|uniref:N-carbamoyl-L-amino-acid hydrolase n=1 Tax=Catenuloplanes nepalensis TaxID=587533 RepID=A0ABT9N7M8_9ACTN|nr:allantoate amidohydrolase [Catenuloplanes nepalensis]MDP9799699.1 N-carbamoyl-L-amino-acid hydrolase [Catenuloplanes nepalensis]